MTPRWATHTIGYVPVTIRTRRERPARPTAAVLAGGAPPANVLTRRRAVDFCRVATAICCQRDSARTA